MRGERHFLILMLSASAAVRLTLESAHRDRFASGLELAHQEGARHCRLHAFGRMAGTDRQLRRRPSLVPPRWIVRPPRCRRIEKPRRTRDGETGDAGASASFGVLL